MSDREHLQDRDPMLGRVIAEKYTLHRVIGIGASGTVYEAKQRSLGRTVAIKVLKAELACDEHFVEKFKAEARAASSMNHPNVVSVIDFGQTQDNVLYLAMEFLHGGTLAQTLRTEQLSAHKICDIVSQILLALEEAHACGVVHADLKSDNIMVVRRRANWDLVKVVDFGISRLVGAHGQEESVELGVSGTPEYMAPEVIVGKGVSFASDIYAVGIILYELLTGETPFAGGHMMQIMQHHLDTKPQLPSERCARPVDRNLEEACMRALDKVPAKRFSSAFGFRSFLEGRSNSAEISESENTECIECGATSSPAFKFCPSCGQARHQVTQTAPTIQLDSSPFGVNIPIPPTQQLLNIPFPVASKARPGKRDLDKVERPRMPPPLVGREFEFQALYAFLGGTPLGTLTLTGGQGVGASRLLLEATTRLAEHDTGPLHVAHCDPSSLASPYYPIRSLLASILELDTPVTLASVGAALEKRGLAMRDQPGIAQIFGCEANPLVSLNHSARQQETTVAAIRALQKGGTLILDDFHLYDRPSKHIIRQLAEANSRSPVIKLIIASQDSDEADWPSKTQIQLKPLQLEAFEEIVQHFDKAALPSLLSAQTLRDMTDGTPGHVMQLLYYLLEGGPPDGFRRSEADLICERIEQLPKAARQVMQAAAAYGQSVSVSRLNDTLGTSVGRVELEASLKLLESRGLLVARGELLCFDRRIVGDIIAASTPMDVRRALHAKIRALLEKANAAPSILGMHAAQAEQNHDAVEFLSQAGTLAMEQLDSFGAAILFRQAQGLARTLMLESGDSACRERYVGMSLQLAKALTLNGEQLLARGLVVEALSHCYDAPLLRAKLLHTKARLLDKDANSSDALSLCRQAIAAAIPTGAFELLCDIYYDLASMLQSAGHLDEAIRELEEGIDLVTLGGGPADTEGPNGLWRLVLHLAQLYSTASARRKAIIAAQHALKHAERVKSPFGAARIQATLSGLLDAEGKHEEALIYRRKAADCMRAMGDRRGTVEILLSATQRGTGVTPILTETLEEALNLSKEIGWSEGVNRATRAARPR